MKKAATRSIDQPGSFYLGRVFDPKTGKSGTEPLLYSSEDLTTHGVVVGMTGSGKTGLCVDLLEEAALNQIPAILVDPKGDLANLLLHFPDLSPADFEPWVDPDEARRQSRSVPQLAQETAGTWKQGLASWGIEPERIARVKASVDYTVYSPGSTAGTPLSILASLQAPPAGWDRDRDALRDRVAGTARALLSLVGIEADPVRSREQILLANLLERAWQEGRDLDLAELIRQVQRPPIERLGAMSVDQFFPEPDRLELAMLLNNLLASPEFQAWLEGDPLDIQSMLWTSDGKPRHSVFYLAHLSDPQRMFFVTLLLTAVDSWVRAQSGTPGLRALLFFDEVYGFLPPVANPPSKEPLLRLLKQARAFGVGVVLATQNPVDLDYKALSNAGTWFVGKLQTEQDKARLLDGLEGASAGGKGFDRSRMDRLISELKPRVFLLHNVHAGGPVLFQTRWAMAYLRGPITRVELQRLQGFGAAAGEIPSTAPEKPAVKAPQSEAASGARPPVPAGIEEYVLPQNQTAAEALKAAGRESSGARTLGLVYRPALLAQAMVRYLDRRINLDAETYTTALAPDPDPRGVIRWEQHARPAVPVASLESQPAGDAGFGELGAPLSDPKRMAQLQRDFMDWVYQTAELPLLSNPTLKLVAAPGTTTAAFREQCAEAARAQRDQEADKLRTRQQKQITALQSKLSREERELAQEQAQLSARKVEEIATHGENLLGLLSGRRGRRISTSLTKHRMTQQVKAQIDESTDAIGEFKRQLADLEAQMAQEMEAISDRWADAVTQTAETSVRPRKADIHKDLFGVAWMPCWRLEAGGDRFELPAYAAEADA